MNTGDLEICLKKMCMMTTKNLSLAGVFANNRLPFRVSRPASIIVNDDPDYMKVTGPLST